jgi:anti-sigma-K factor RskA
VLGAQVLAISVEPKGGSPTGGPTGEVRFAGPMQAI